jgi:hypothetical protein
MVKAVLICDQTAESLFCLQGERDSLLRSSQLRFSSPQSGFPRKLGELHHTIGCPAMLRAPVSAIATASIATTRVPG